MLSPLLPLLLATGTLLGFGLPLARWLAPQGVDSLAFALWPTAVAGVLLAVLARLRDGAVLRWCWVRFGAIAGFAGYALPMTLAFWLAARAGAAFAAIAFTLPPLFTLLVNLLLRRERWQWRRGAGIAVGLGGAMLLAWHGQPPGTADGWAIAAVFVIPALIGAANVYRAIHLPAGATASALGALTLLAAAAMLAMAAVASDRGTVPLAAPVLGGLALQAAALVAGYILYFELQKRADPVIFSLMGYVMMLTSACIGVLLLGEPARWVAVPAALLVLLAIRLVAVR